MFRNSIFNPEDKLSELRKEKADMEEIHKLCIGKKPKTVHVVVHKNRNMFKGLLCLNDIMFEEEEYYDFSIFTIYDEE